MTAFLYGVEMIVSPCRDELQCVGLARVSPCVEVYKGISKWYWIRFGVYKDMSLGGIVKRYASLWGNV
ncbi:MAG: hypothetical protein NZ901_09485 [Geminocystis sp.]|nr:hypothetical protein [Geminocystis sp.]HIK38870.1 hypothetical protein [Geminocystis sp. M7585_C2015_104]MCS7148407.1 hypothetical protein [Geminocystis sp.]MCX8078278.1 hypothetical protein [Geminocystis sp.]MDW8116005.1 hypothetical protein [Geminocystis sp.]